MEVYRKIIRPILSEKSTASRDEQNKYSFIVARDASKDEVKKAIEGLFSVKVLKINTLITRGKIKRRGMHYTKLKNTKKAVVSVQAGQAIKIFEDQ